VTVFAPSSPAAGAAAPAGLGAPPVAAVVVAAAEEVAAANVFRQPVAAAAVEVLASPLHPSRRAAAVVAVVTAVGAGVPVPPGASVTVAAAVRNPERTALAQTAQTVAAVVVNVRVHGAASVVALVALPARAHVPSAVAAAVAVYLILHRVLGEHQWRRRQCALEFSTLLRFGRRRRQPM
jgi:hypothetical protein